MAIPTGIYNLFYQPGNTEYYLTLDPNAQFQPTISVFIPGAKSQQWQVSGDAGTNLRAVCSVSTGSCIGRSAVNVSDTLVEPTPVPWYLASSPFGPGWYKFSATANDGGPWWVVGIDPNNNPVALLLDSGGWNIFFFRPVQADTTIASLPPSSSAMTSLSAAIATSSSIQSTSSTSFNASSTSSTSFSSSSSLSTSAVPTSSTGLSPTTSLSASGSSNALSRGDVASLASSIPLGILGLLLAGWTLWFSIKQHKQGKPVMRTLVTNIQNVFHPDTPRRNANADYATGGDGRA